MNTGSLEPITFNLNIKRLNVTSVSAASLFVPSPDHVGFILLPPNADLIAKNISNAFTFCTTKISYRTQTAVAVMPCSLHSIAIKNTGHRRNHRAPCCTYEMLLINVLIIIFIVFIIHFIS